MIFCFEAVSCPLEVALELEGADRSLRSKAQKALNISRLSRLSWWEGCLSCKMKQVPLTQIKWDRRYFPFSVSLSRIALSRIGHFIFPIFSFTMFHLCERWKLHELISYLWFYFFANRWSVLKAFSTKNPVLLLVLGTNFFKDTICRTRTIT